MKLLLPLISFLTLASIASANTEIDVHKDQIGVEVYYTRGVSAKSTWHNIPEIILFKSHTHFHVKIANQSSEPITLWQPGCADADYAVTIEFRELDDHEKVNRARTVRIYTGGSGVPKTFSLASHDDFIINVDFIHGGWSFPLALKQGEIREVEMRVVYSSVALKHPEWYTHLDGSRWIGSVSSPWNKVRLINRTKKTFGPFPPHIRSSEMAIEDIKNNRVFIYYSGPHSNPNPIGVSEENSWSIKFFGRRYLEKSLHPAVYDRASVYNNAVIEAL